jgi:chromosome partitioning protein
VIIAVFNPKGGVGKTTTVVNVGATLAASGRRVLVVDLEADMNASISLGVRPTDTGPSIVDVLLHDRRPTDAIRPVNGIRHLSLITGSPRLWEMDHSLRHVRQSERRLADVLRPLVPSFDAILLDSPSGYSVLSQSIPLTAEHLVVPVRAEYLSLESLAAFLRWYRDRRVARKTIAQICGLLLTMVDYRRPATREIVDIIRVHNRRGVFETEIPNDPLAAEAPSHGVPLVRYARSKAATAYKDVTGELLTRLQRRARTR